MASHKCQNSFSPHKTWGSVTPLYQENNDLMRQNPNIESQALLFWGLRAVEIGNPWFRFKKYFISYNFRWKVLASSREALSLSGSHRLCCARPGEGKGFRESRTGRGLAGQTANSLRRLRHYTGLIFK